GESHQLIANVRGHERVVESLPRRYCPLPEGAGFLVYVLTGYRAVRVGVDLAQLIQERGCFGAGVVDEGQVLPGTHAAQPTAPRVDGSALLIMLLRRHPRVRLIRTVISGRATRFCSISRSRLVRGGARDRVAGCRR